MSNPSLVATALRFLRPQASAPGKADQALVARIHHAISSWTQRSDEALIQRVAGLRSEVAAGQAVSCAEVVVPAFALVHEAVRRTLSIELYDVQFLGGLALVRGGIAEMPTGEGKTLAALLPACVHALAGRGVHVMTVNAYLAERDFQLLSPVFHRLGLSVGLLASDLDPSEKRVVYARDVTYGPGYEFGFDFLRDQVALSSRQRPKLGQSFHQRLQGHTVDAPLAMQREHAVAIVDEADSVMIDEATTPLILAAGGKQPAENAHVYQAARQAITGLLPDRDFIVDPAEFTAQLTADGLRQLESAEASIPGRGLDRPWRVYVEQALRGEQLFHRDVHYVVRDDEVQIVDQSTGRIFADRSWQLGLQQAVQAKEGVTITSETPSVARITRQRYFRLYQHLCGMTGTARGSERELRDVFGLQVVTVPPHKPCQRRRLPTRVFADRSSKERAIIQEIACRHQSGQPVLVGTASIETSERLARQLDQISVPYQLLNGKQDAEEAEIVAHAGLIGTVTIATNMAGRGTDIRLAPGVTELGGLHVIATEPQESARVDRQLVGRAARQGDPGSCQLFTSADDVLIQRQAHRLAARMRQSSGEANLREAELISTKITKLQKQLERRNARQRSQMFAADDWVEQLMRELT